MSFSMVKIESFFFKIKKKQGCLLSSFLFNIILEVLARAIRQEKEIKSFKIGRKEVKLSLFAHDIILHSKNTKDYTEILLDLIYSGKCRLQN